MNWVRIVSFAIAFTCVMPAHAGPPNLRNLRIIDNTPALASAQARTVRNTATLRSNRGTFHTDFKNANIAREYKPPTADRLGDVHSSTRKLADDPRPSHVGMRMESKQVIASDGTKYKTTSILDSSGKVTSYSAKPGNGYLTGASNARFSEGTRGAK